MWFQQDPHRTLMVSVYLDPNEPQNVCIFVDKSVVEIFVNGKQCVAVPVYPERSDSVGISLRAQGKDAVLKGLDIWQMQNSEIRTTVENVQYYADPFANVLWL